VAKRARCGLVGEVLAYIERERLRGSDLEGVAGEGVALRVWPRGSGLEGVALR